MKKALLYILAIISAASAVSAKISLNVVYPRSGQQIQEVDSTFIFGNVTPGARLFINNLPVKIHKSGGWLTFQDIRPGTFIFHLIAISNNDTASLDWQIQVGSAPDTASDIESAIRDSFFPRRNSWFRSGEIIEFGYRASPYGDAAIIIDARDTIKTITSFSPDVFGTVNESSRADYKFDLAFGAADTGWHSAGAAFVDFKKDTSIIDSASSIYIIPEYPSMIGELVGTRHIIRTAPYAGYKLLYMPPGLRMKIIGLSDSFYEFKLAEGISGFMNVDSVGILPAGIAAPQSYISRIDISDSARFSIISIPLAMPLPYEIEEDFANGILNIDLYGATGDVDWITNRGKSKLIEIVDWCQPQNDIVRIVIHFTPESIGGYQPYYSNGKFNIRLSPRLLKSKKLSSKLKGVKIAVDPGHSTDTGAIGPTGLVEKDVNLYIAHKVRRLLEEKGAKVLMTRRSNENVPLYSRPAMAEEWGADLLVSIHNNALPDGTNPYTNNGTAVYYYHPHSLPLAEAIHSSLLEKTKLPNYGLNYGNLVLTRPTAMPSVLVECAFMMIPEQEALLKTEKFQKKCAEAIVQGIINYISR